MKGNADAQTGVSGVHGGGHFLGPAGLPHQGMVMEPTVAALALLAPETMPNSALAQADT